VFCGWLIRTLLRARSSIPDIRHDAWSWYRHARDAHIMMPFIVLGAVLVFGFIRGIVMDYGFHDVFFDANGYAFFALFPVMMEIVPHPRFRTILPILLSSAIVMTVGKALLVLYIFS